MLGADACKATRGTSMALGGEMNMDRGDFESCAESLPDGRERTEALEAVARIKQLQAREVEQEKEMEAIHQSGVGSSKGDRTGCFLFFLPLAYLLVSGLYRGRFPNFFHKHIQYTYWSEEPYIFAFMALFLGAAASILLGIALGFGRTWIGRRPTIASTRRAKTHARDA
jgi:hypothetical protein